MSQTQTQTTAPAVTVNGPKPPAKKTAVAVLGETLQLYRKQIEMALPRHLTPERMIRAALTQFSRSPTLAECTTLSVLGCVIQASELGLELSSPLGQAYMVPYKNKHTGKKEAQFQIGYRGLVDLAYRSGRVQTFSAHVVYTNDKFSYQLGTNAKINHVPTESEPGEIRFVYAVLKMANGGIDFEVMSKAAVDRHRAKYSKARAAEFSPWETAWEEMAKKTAIRKLAKRAPVSVELVKAAVLDEYGEEQVPQNLLPVDIVDVPALPAPEQGPSKSDRLASELGARQETSEMPEPDRQPGDETGQEGEGVSFEEQERKASIARYETTIDGCQDASTAGQIIDRLGGDEEILGVDEHKRLLDKANKKLAEIQGASGKRPGRRI